MKKKGIILASSSPRRQYLLRMILKNFGLKFDIIPANIKECIPKKAENYSVFVKNLALTKAKSIANTYGGVVIGADTIVVLNGKVLGKPATFSEAKQMLKLLSGKEHKVYTGIAIIDTERKSSFVDYEVSRVRFRELTKNEIDYYVKSESPMDKAGAYGIQDDFGSTFVSKISGDYFNVVGLPVVKTYLGLKKILNLRF